MALVDVKTWAEIVEIGFKCLAIVTAGVWAVLLLFMLRQREQAQANLRKTDAEIRRLDLESRKQAVVRVDINPTVHRDPDGSGYIILATVDLTNRGSRNTQVKWRNEPPAFYVRPARFGTDGRPEYEDAAEFRVLATLNPDHEPPSHVIRAGGMESIPFAFRVSSPGLYLLSFRAAVDEQERSVSMESGATKHVAWTGSKYVLAP